MPLLFPTHNASSAKPAYLVGYAGNVPYATLATRVGFILRKRGNLSWRIAYALVTIVLSHYVTLSTCLGGDCALPAAYQPPRDEQIAHRITSLPATKMDSRNISYPKRR